MRSRELDVGEEFRITLNEYNLESNKLLICFSEQGGGMKPEGFGSRACKKYGWNQIYVGKAPHTRYRTMNIERFVKAVDPVLSGLDVMCYGTSLGGYAALYYGGSINARILAASPRMPGHPLVQNEAASIEDFAHHVNLSAVPLSIHTPYVVYDNRQNQDHKLVQRWLKPAYPSVKSLIVPRSGHKSLQRLLDYGTLSRMLRMFVDREDIDRECIRAADGTLDRKVDNAFDAFEDGNFCLAADLFDELATSMPDSHSIGMYAASVIKSEDARCLINFRHHIEKESFSILNLRGLNKNLVAEARGLRRPRG